MADRDLTRPAFRYSSAGRRPERLNQSRDVNVPVQLARGWAAGLLGLPGDVEGLVRMLPGIRNETPVLPTSDFYREALPGYDPRPAARALSGLGALTGGAGATSVVRGGLGAVKRAADPEAIRQYVRATQGMTGLPGAAVVKPKGGNWITGNVEGAVRPLRTTIVGMEPAERIPVVEDVIRQYEAAGEGAAPFVERMRADKQRLTGEAALNQWIDQKLAKYIRNEMGTPEDPLRALAERDVLHVDPENLTYGRHTVHPSGEVFEKLGVSPAARQWEAASDYAIIPEQARTFLRTRNAETGIPTVERNPWLTKVPPETTVYDLSYAGSSPSDLGFDHLVDELRNAITPNSGLPRELQLKPEQLSRVTMPQAVELVDRINKWRAAQKAEADLARSTNIATFEHKAYPEQGYRWVELRLPEESTPLPEGYSLSTVTNERLPPGHMGRNSYAVVDPQGRMLEGTGTAYTEADAMGKFKRAYYGKALEDALKYEGEVMGHCVGGYCPDVMEGRSRIFSLRDAKGQPHVTVEVTPKKLNNWDDVTAAVGEEKAKQLWAEFDALGGYKAENAEQVFNQLMQERGVQPLMDIKQIKGKGNRAPKEDYLPYVQDFVRSGQWGRVGDLQNTGLVEFTSSRQTVPRALTGAVPRFEEAGIAPGYYTEAELLEQLRDWQRRSGLEPGYAAGGLVSSYDPARIEALVDEIMAPAA